LAWDLAQAEAEEMPLNMLMEREREPVLVQVSLVCPSPVKSLPMLVYKWD